MRNSLLTVWLLGFSVLATAQEIIIDTSYYIPPSQRKPLLTPDPANRPNSRPLYREQYILSETALLNQFRDVHSWYVVVEGGLRQDVSQLSNTFNGLISNPAASAWTGGVLVGYTYRNAWNAEFGYTYAPTHLNITLASSPAPYQYSYKNSGYGLPVRIKWHVGAGKRTVSNTGIWLSAGAWLIPNGDQKNDLLQFTGRSGRGGPRSRFDTLEVTVNTGTANRLTGVAEAGVDYTARISSLFEMGFYVRKYWGLSSALRSDLTYRVNRATETTSSITANGTGWSAGISLRYVYSRKREVREPVLQYK